MRPHRVSPDLERRPQEPRVVLYPHLRLIAVVPRGVQRPHVLLHRRRGRSGCRDGAAIEREVRLRHNSCLIVIGGVVRARKKS
jgi:hypothetical protein